MKPISRLGAVAILAFLLPCGCLPVSLRLIRVRVDEPIPTEHLATLVPGESDLSACLQALGAPHFVWEYKRDGMALAWGWIDRWEFGFRLGYTPEEFVPSAEFSMDWDSQDVPGVLLLLDPQLRLEEVRRGVLRDIVPSSRRRPAAVEERP